MYAPIIHVLCAALALDCPRYQMRTTVGPSCGILGQAGAIGFGISESGTICGLMSKCNGDSWPFVQFPTGPAFPLTQVGAEDSGRAWDVNSEGVAVGYTDSDPLSFRYHNGRAQWLQPLPGDLRSEAERINENGVAAGASSGDFWRATIWIGTEPRAIDLPVGPSAIATDISELNAVCGWMGVYPLPNFGATPFIWHDGKATALPLPPTAAFNTGAATAINNHGDACGYYFIYDRKTKSYVRQGCAWIDGQLIELATLPGVPGMFPLGINDAREIVGYCTDITGNDAYPFVWRDGVTHSVRDMIPPPPTGKTTLGVARGINNKGQIVGSGVHEEFDPDHSYSIAFLLTPALPSTPGDVNCDSIVNVTDLLGVISAWDPIGPVGGRPADLNRDNAIDVLDLIETILNWG